MRSGLSQAVQPNILELPSENLAALHPPFCRDDQDEDTLWLQPTVRMLEKHDLNSAVPTFPDLPIVGGILIDKRKRPDWAGHNFDPSVSRTRRPRKET